MNDSPTVLIPLPRAAEPHALPIGHKRDGFEIRGIVGMGGFGIVYAAWDLGLQREVALKEYFPANLAKRDEKGHVGARDADKKSTFDAGLCSFVNEARLLAQFDQPALVKVYSFWESHGTAHMVMPLYKGTTLSDWCVNAPTEKTEAAILSIFLPVAKALDTLHQQQCYHRDISPDNILVLTDTGQPILLDFGAARRAIGIRAQAFTVILKTSYAPIEQYAEDHTMQQGPWTDVYALAAVLHFLITGKTPPSSVARMVSDNYKPLVEQGLPFSKGLLRAVDKGLALLPENRIRNMQDFQLGLLGHEPLSIDMLLNDTPLAPPKPELPPESLVRKPNHPMQTVAHVIKQRRAVLMLLIASVVAVFASSVYLFHRDESSSGSRTEPAYINTSAQGEFDAVDSTALAFDEVRRLSSGNLIVQLEKNPLTIGKDLLRFTLTSPVNGYATVYVKSSDGHLLRVLPNPRVPSTAVLANTPVEFPPANEPMQASGPVGENQILVIVTEHARSFDHLLQGDHYGYGLVKPGTQSGLAGKSPCTGGPACSDRLWSSQFSVFEVE